MNVKINNKYTVVMEPNGCLRALRHNEPWRDCVSDNLVYSMAARIEDLEAGLAQILKSDSIEDSKEIAEHTLNANSES